MRCKPTRDGASDLLQIRDSVLGTVTLHSKDLLRSRPTTYSHTRMVQSQPVSWLSSRYASQTDRLRLRSTSYTSSIAMHRPIGFVSLRCRYHNMDEVRWAGGMDCRRCSSSLATPLGDRLVSFASYCCVPPDSPSLSVSPPATTQREDLSSQAPESPEPRSIFKGVVVWCVASHSAVAHIPVSRP